MGLIYRNSRKRHAKIPLQSNPISKLDFVTKTFRHGEYKKVNRINIYSSKRNKIQVNLVKL